MQAPLDSADAYGSYLCVHCPVWLCIISLRCTEQSVLLRQGTEYMPRLHVTYPCMNCNNVSCEHVQGVKKYVPFQSYAQSKLACLMTAVELHDRCKAQSRQLNLDSATAVTCTAVHPGLVDTPLARYYFENDYIKPAFLRPVLRPLLRGLFPVALLRPKLSVSNMDLAMFGTDDVERKYVRSNSAIDVFGEAKSTTACARLWDTSLELAGIQSPFHWSL